MISWITSLSLTSAGLTITDSFSSPCPFKVTVSNAKPKPPLHPFLFRPEIRGFSFLYSRGKSNPFGGSTLGRSGEMPGWRDRYHLFPVVRYSGPLLVVTTRPLNTSVGRPDQT
ncbi:hypothetical protein F4861DRAFT_116899 [Xylaria intraflava]|nr:hypothetical protein F4861DRAFT_116899 [Xylaria intraflava]